MHSPNLDEIKLRALLHLQDVGHCDMYDGDWSFFDELQKNFSEHAKKFVSLALAELESEGLVIISSGTVFLRRPLHANTASLQIDLDTAVQIASINCFHSAAVPANPLRLSREDLRRYCATTLALIKVAKENKEEQNKVANIAEELRLAKLELTHSISENEKLRQKLNALKKSAKDAELGLVLATHAIVEGICKQCGLSRKLIESSHIYCDHAKA